MKLYRRRLNKSKLEMHFGRAQRFFLLAAMLSSFTGCQRIPLPQNSRAEPTQKNSAKEKTAVYGPPRVIATLTGSEVTEGSGIVACHTPGVYWTHNDSGDGPFLYAIDKRGRTRGVFRVVDAKARDWEDIASGPGPDAHRRYLYIGDIGDNSDRRTELVVYRIPEPPLTANDALSNKQKPRLTEPAEAIKLRYPDGAHDAEALLVHPVSGDLYLITKEAFAKPIVYKAASPLATDPTIRLVKMAELSIPSLFGGVITGAAVAPDGHRVALCDYMQGYELVIPAATENFDDIWKQPMTTIDLGRRGQGEAVTYRLDGKALLATSEGKSSPLIEVVRR